MRAVAVYWIPAGQLGFWVEWVEASSLSPRLVDGREEWPMGHVWITRVFLRQHIV